MNAQPAIVIRSDQLRVEIASPGTVYRRTRFDWSGIVTQVTLDGKHTFCTVEDPDPKKGTGGIGLCGEFGNEQAIGYAEALPGELFPKPGIGLLRKVDVEPYKFMRDYEIIEPFPIQVETAADRVSFSVQPVACRGYAFRTTKTLRVVGNRLELVESIENVGEKALHTEEYLHNFIAIDEHPLGPEYLLQFLNTWQPLEIAEAYRPLLPGLLKKLPRFALELLLKQFMDNRILVVKDNEVTLRSKPRKAFYGRTAGLAASEQAQWQISHLPSRVLLREYTDFTPWRVVIWGTAHVISAEVFVDLQVAPGEKRSWTRRFEFGASRPDLRPPLLN